MDEAAPPRGAASHGVLVVVSVSVVVGGVEEHAVALLAEERDHGGLSARIRPEASIARTHRPVEVRAWSPVVQAEGKRRIDRGPASGDAMPTKVPRDRRGHGRAGYPNAAAEQRVRERPVVAHADLAHAVLGLALGEVDMDGAIRRSERPQESVGSDAGVVVYDLMRARVEGVNYPPIDVESDEREGPLVTSPVGTAEGALHEAHVGIEE